ncbi:hypothetical protein H072_1773 [Dactylellina haptotyla CBS 200.50]|uniref:BRCT domain-containing protein n=1 Tax=Dactylellina haptotyla (strain CBS 200.50) TaxID=1284197 RepID=S8C952_DACHA|nr:hypothetical protein H072_1773 [Dactylellina haptotyla CBS 200.50]
MPQLSASLKGSELRKKLVELASTTRPGKPLDIYVTSSTGHQIREDGGSASGWQADRNRKLRSQFSNNGTVAGTKRKANETPATTKNASEMNQTNNSKDLTTATTQSVAEEAVSKPKQIFTNCVIYINGNTSLSGISDVELKRLLTSHGATVSYHLARRQVTHIILTNPSAASSLLSSQTQQSSTASTASTQVSKTITSSGTAILASRKIELEMKGRIKSKIHYVSVEWALSSLKEGKRLAETKFPVVPLRESRQGTLMDCKRVKPSGQRSLKDMMKK